MNFLDFEGNPLSVGGAGFLAVARPLFVWPHAPAFSANSLGYWDIADTSTGKTPQPAIDLMDCSMVRPLRPSFLPAAAMICVAVATVGGCTANEPITSWDSPRLLEVQKEWDSLPRIGGKQKNEEQQNKLDRVLQRSLSYDDLRHLAATCGSLAVREKDRSDFANAVLVYMEKTFVDRGDRDNLVKVLSTRCQLHIAVYTDIEFYLAFFGKKLKDPILVLGEAFSKCQVPEVRHDLAGAVHRGFLGLGIQGKDDAEYVANAMQWYEKEKGHLTVNQKYWMNTLMYPADLFDEMPEYYEKREKAPPGHFRVLLFEKKPSGK